MTCSRCRPAACRCESNDNPRIDRPGAPGDTSGARPACRPSASLVESMGATVDSLRQLYTDMGLRPYRVFSVLVRWTGGAVGRGRPEVVREVEFLPTPRLREVSSVRTELRSGGRVERGTVWLEQISPRLTEDEVRRLVAPSGLGAGEEAWIEVRIDERDGNTVRRRFVTSGVPERDAEGFQWRVRLVRQDEGRSRSGEPSDVDGSIGRQVVPWGSRR